MYIDVYRRNTVELLYCRHHGSTAVCLEYRGVRILEASGIFMVGVAVKVHSRVPLCCTLAGNASASLSWEHQEYRASVVGSLTVRPSWFGSGHAYLLAVTCIMIAMFAGSQIAG